jgi:hypothetical protein
MELDKERIPLQLLQFSAGAVFLGRAWQHLYWDAPFRVLLWDESLLRGAVETVLGWSWRQYVGSPEVDEAIQWLIRGVGALYLLAAVAVYLHRRAPRISNAVVAAGGFNLIFLAFLETKAHFFYPAQFFEYSLQFSAPFFLLAYRRDGAWSPGLILAMKAAIALTFVSHGLFAAGYYPRPGYFVEMVMKILRLDQDSAVAFLNAAGLLDFVTAAAIFLPRRAARWALAYMIFWGFATTMARIAAHFYPELWTYTLSRWVHESLFRFPHFLIPALVWLLTFQGREQEPVPPC